MHQPYEKRKRPSGIARPGILHMTSLPDPQADSHGGWGSQYRLVASEKWKAKSAAMGQAVTDALVEYAQPKPGMRVLDLASGTGEPAVSLAMCVGSEGTCRRS